MTNNEFLYKESLRLYTGDTRIRKPNGRLTVDESKDAIYGDKEIYITLNTLLFSGIENERVRVREGKHFNLELIRKPVEILKIMKGIMTGIRQMGCLNQDMIVYRLDRADSLRTLEDGYISSFFSCKKSGFDKNFIKKEDPITLEVHLSKGSYGLEISKLLGSEYYNSEEEEVLILPYTRVKIERCTDNFLAQVSKSYRVWVLPGMEFDMKRRLGISFSSEMEAMEYLMCDEHINFAAKGLQAIQAGNLDDSAISVYEKWKGALQYCVLLMCCNNWDDIGV